MAAIHWNGGREDDRRQCGRHREQHGADVVGEDHHLACGASIYVNCVPRPRTCCLRSAWPLARWRSLTRAG